MVYRGIFDSLKQLKRPRIGKRFKCLCATAAAYCERDGISV